MKSVRKGKPGAVKAFRVFDDNGVVRGRIVRVDRSELDPGDVTIKVSYSSVNFKDALAATTPKVVRRFPCIGGIDLSGTVVESASRQFRIGDEVIATSYDLGTAHDGGYASYCRLPASWIVPKPSGLSLWEAMALGTAGYTVGLALTRMERAGLEPSSGPILVTGATGGVGSLAIDILAKRGYEVVALTGKPDHERYLKRIGAAAVILRDSVPLDALKPLGAARWGGVIDNLGGRWLAWSLSTLRPGGILAMVGRAASPELETTVMPWILRGISALGIGSADTAMPERSRVWKLLAHELRAPHLDRIAKTIALEQLSKAFATMLEGRAVGRMVVRLRPARGAGAVPV